MPVVLGGTHRIVRGSPFTIDVLDPIEAQPPDPDAFTPTGRGRAHALVERYAVAVAEILPARTALADERRPARDRWPWLATLFH